MKKFLVIGNPIEHSFSPKLHNYWIKKKNINAVYDKKLANEEDIESIISEIRNEKITREEGVALVKKYDQEFPDRFFKEFLDYISIDESEFWNTIDKFRPDHLWTKQNNIWKLKHTVYD